MQERARTGRQRTVCTLLTALAIIIGNAGLARPAEKVVLKAVTAFARDTTMVKMGYIDWETRVKQMIEKQYPGELELKWVGGPDAIGQMDQIGAVKKGVVDIAMMPSPYCESMVPEAGAVKYSQHTPMEDRTHGAYDVWNRIFKAKNNCIYLGRHGRNTGFYFFLNKELTKPDLSGIKFRTPPGVFSDFTIALGGSPVTIPSPEVYTALQRGLVDGFLTAYVAAPDFAWQEVTKYMIGYGFYTDPLLVFVNLNTWNKLPKHLQTLLMDASKESERYAWETLSKEQNDIARQKYEQSKVRPIKFEDADAKRFLDMAYRVAWEDSAKKFPESVAELKRVLSK